MHLQSNSPERKVIVRARGEMVVVTRTHKHPLKRNLLHFTQIAE